MRACVDDVTSRHSEPRTAFLSQDPQISTVRSARRSCLIERLCAGVADGSVGQGKRRERFVRLEGLGERLCAGVTDGIAPQRKRRERFVRTPTCGQQPRDPHASGPRSDSVISRRIFRLPTNSMQTTPFFFFFSFFFFLFCKSQQLLLFVLFLFLFLFLSFSFFSAGRALFQVALRSHVCRRRRQTAYPQFVAVVCVGFAERRP